MTKSVNCGSCGDSVPIVELASHARDVHLGPVLPWACPTCSFRAPNFDAAVRHAFAVRHPVMGIACEMPSEALAFLQRLQDQDTAAATGLASPNSGTEEEEPHTLTPNIALPPPRRARAASRTPARWSPYSRQEAPAEVAPASPLTLRTAKLPPPDEEEEDSGPMTPAHFASLNATLPATLQSAPSPVTAVNASTPLGRGMLGELHEACSRCGRKVKVRNERGVICRGMAVSHLKTCLDIKPWACAYCDKLFPDKFPVTKHSAKHHGDGSDNCLKMILPDKAGVEERLRTEMAAIFPSVPMDGWRGIE